MRSLEEKYLEMKDKTERLRSQIEEQNIKHLDALLAHSGDNPKMQEWEGIRSWWLWYKYTGMKDPPNKDMEFQGHFKVTRAEVAMSAHVASADVYHDETIERRRKVYVTGARGLKGLTEEEVD